MGAREYEYTKLKDVTVATNLNVYGVITELIKVNCITSNGKMHSMITIIDETLPKNKPFRIHFFLTPTDSSLELKKGNIIRLHRVKVEEWDGVFDGRVFRGSDVAIFLGTGTSDFSYFTLAKKITFTEKDKARVEELREIIMVDNLFLESEEENEEFEALVTDSQRVTFRVDDDGTDDDSPGDKETPNLKEMASKKTLLLNPMNEKFRYLSKQKGPKDHELSGTSSDIRSSGVPGVLSQQYGSKRKSPSDKENAPGPSSSPEVVNSLAKTGPSSKKLMKSPAVAHILPMSNLHTDSSPEIILNKFKSYDRYSMLAQNGSLDGLFESLCPGEACTEKVKIINIKPKLEALQVFPKNLLSGTCYICHSFTFYSSLKWKKDQGSLIKRPMCPVCFKTGREEFVTLNYRIKLIVRDVLDNNMDIYAVNQHASALLGITPSEFMASKANRAKAIQVLSSMISEKSFISLKFCRVGTPFEPILYLQD